MIGIASSSYLEACTRSYSFRITFIWLLILYLCYQKAQSSGLSI